MQSDYRDLCIEDLSDAVAAQREAVRQLVGLVSDLAFENAQLEFLWKREHLARLHADAHVRRLQHLLYRQRKVT